MPKNNIVAFIPVRGKSKSIPLKNIKDFCGKPLVYWSVLACELTPQINKVFVATDSLEIKKVVESFGFKKVEVIGRSRSTATDTASTESALLEFAAKARFDTIILVQATSPLVNHNELSEAIKQYQSSNIDSLLSVARQKRFLWAYDKQEGAYSLNYDFRKRPRRQDFSGNLVENGAFYIIGREQLLESKNRLDGKIGIYQMPDYTYYELDEPDDWIVMEQLAGHTKQFYLNYWLKQIKVLALDVDGVLSDGGAIYTRVKDQTAKFSRIDGKGIMLMHEANKEVWVVSAEESDIVRKRCEKLKVKHVYLGVKDKLSLVKKLAVQNKLKAENICFVGDDVQDIPVMSWAGFSAAPSNAIEKVKSKAKYVCKRSGGNGAVREVIEMILR